MGATEDFLKQLQKRRQQQLEQIGELFQQRTGDMGSPMQQPEQRGSIIGGLLKTRASQQIGLATPAPGSGQAGGGPIGGAGPTAGTGGGGGIGALGGAAAVPSAAGMTFSLPSAAAGAAGAIPMGLSSAGAAGGAAAGAGGATGALGAAVSKIAELISSLFSSRRLKHEIETYRQIRDLRWVFFKYLPAIDPDQTPLLGLIAEEVYETRPEIVCLDEQGDPIAINYDLIPTQDWPDLETACKDLLRMIHTWQ